MSLLETTRYFLAETERVSGRPVVVQEDSALQTFATCQIARGSAPAHFLRYRPVPSQAPDYQICYQCGFILRLFENEPSNRFSLAVTTEGSKGMGGWLSEGLVSPQLKLAKDFLLASLLTQLRSTPIGLRIDNLLWDRHEELRDLQVASARQQMAENVKSLAPAVRQGFPPKLLKANTTMNAAYAQFWSEQTGEQTLELPYRSIGANTDGKVLMDLFTTLDHSSAGDWGLVDQWAIKLGLVGWYKWIKHELEQ